jgi:hypothetical protein
MWAIVVVVVDELSQDRTQVALAEGVLPTNADQG